MKKSYVIVALLLAFAMLFGMVACQTTGTKEPEKTDSPSGEVTTDPATDPATDPVTDPIETDPTEPDPTLPEGPFEVKFTASVTMEQQNMTLTIPATLTVKYASLDSISLDAAVDMMGTSMELNTYFDGETLYINANDELIKITKDEMLDMIAESDIPGFDGETFDPEEMLANIDEETVEMITKIVEAAVEVCGEYITTAEENGAVITKLDLPKAGMKALVEKIGEISGNPIDEESLAAFDAVDVGNLVCTVTVRDDAFSAMTFNWTINNVPVDEESVMSLTLDMNLQVVATGEDVKVEAPENLDEYIPYSEYEGGMIDDPDGEEQLVMAEIIDLLYDDNLQPVEDYDKVYAQCVETYGQETVDSAIAMIMAYEIQAKVMALYDENFQPVEGYEEAINSLKAEYGEDAVDEAVANIEAMIEMFGNMEFDIEDIA